MWNIRILSGPQAGQTFTLKEGKNKIGRSPLCDVQLSGHGISKEHVEISMIGEKIVFTDLNSSNGIFLNGVKVKGGILNPGDKLSLSDTILDVKSVFQNNMVPAKKVGPSKAGVPQNYPNFQQPMIPSAQNPYQVPSPYTQQGYQTPGHQGMPLPNNQGGSAAAHVKLNIFERFDRYAQNVIAPSIHSLVEQFDFKMVLAGFVSIYVLLMTVLTTIPMNQITSESISIESRRRAMTVARTLAAINEKLIRSGDLSAFSTDLFIKEEGVDDLYVVDKDGRIVAPADRVGMMPKEVSFYRKYKEAGRDVSDVIGDKVGAAVPIMVYDSEIQKNVAKAYAVVVYNPSTMTFDDGRALSLFVQMLALAAGFGGILFFIFYKLVEYPYIKLNKEIDEALRDNKDHIHLNIKIDSLKSLLNNINTILSRLQNPSSSAHQSEGIGAKHAEYFNILNLIGFPALLISHDGYIKKANSSFEAVTNMSAQNIENQKIEMLPDQAMQKNIFELTKTAAAQPHHIATDKLEISGHQFKLSCQVLTTSSGEVDGYFLTISPDEDSEGSAA